MTCDVTKNRTTFQHRKQKILKKICCSSYTSITAKHTQFVKAVHCDNLDKNALLQRSLKSKKDRKQLPVSSQNKGSQCLVRKMADELQQAENYYSSDEELTKSIRYGH